MLLNSHQALLLSPKTLAHKMPHSNDVCVTSKGSIKGTNQSCTISELCYSVNFINHYIELCAYRIPPKRLVWFRRKYAEHKLSSAGFAGALPSPSLLTRSCGAELRPGPSVGPDEAGTALADDQSASLTVFQITASTLLYKLLRFGLS